MRSRVDHPESLSRYGRVMAGALCAAEFTTRRIGHKGYWHVTRFLGGGASNEYATVTDGPVRMRIALADPYWARLVSAGYLYEPEVASVLAQVMRPDVDFLDVGANIGYWSLWVAARFPDANVLALEPNPAVFAALQKNIALNGGGVAARRVAISPGSSDHVRFRIPDARGAHANASVVDEGFNADLSEVVDVPAESLDDVMDGFRVAGRRLLIKLDIEGLENDVFENARHAFDPEVALLYEDHGADLACRPTAVLLERGGLLVYFLDPRIGPVPIDSVVQLSALKVRPKVGYNCLAVAQDSEWGQVLRDYPGS